MKKKEKLLFVVNEPKFFLSHRFSLAQSAIKAGYDVHVAAAVEPEAKEIEAAGITFHSFSISKYSLNPITDIKSFFSLLKLYREVQPTLVHHVTIKPVIYGSLASYFVGGIKGVVNAISGLGFIFLQKGLKAQVRQGIVLALYKMSLAGKRLIIITQNPDDEQLLLRYKLIKKEQLRRIRGSGADDKIFLPSAPQNRERAVVMLVARLLREKGIAEFVSAATLLSEQGVMARFVVVGERPEGNPGAVLEEDLTSWKSQGIVEFWGARSKMWEVYEQVDLVCLPSYREGLPKVLIEAAACGKPIVTTDVPGCREIVRDRENGLLVPAKSVEALVEALKELIESPELRQKFGARGREIFLNEGFSEEVVIAQHLAIYEELCNRS